MHASRTTPLPTGPSSNDAAFTGTGTAHWTGPASRPARRTLRGISALAATSGLLLAGAGAASAHVSVDPASTTEGGYSQLTFSVPSESTDTTTSKIEVALPTETPFTSVRVKPVEGWTSEVIRGDLPESIEVDGATLTEAPLTVIWTADDEEHQLTAQQYQTFSLSVGTLPEAGTTVELPVTQSYADGTVRAWDEPAIEGEEEPENPAPSFITTASEGTDSHGAASAEATDEAAAGTSELEPEQAATTTDASGTVLGWIGLSAGVLGLLVGALALARTRGQRQN